MTPNLSGNSTFKLKKKRIDFLQTHSFSLHKTLIDGLEWCGLLVDYCDVFISCVDSRSDGTHLLQRIHWLANDATFLQIYIIIIIFASFVNLL